MLFLLLNIVFASSFVLVIKWVQNRQREDIITVGAINYIVAAVLTLPAFVRLNSSVDLPAVVCGASLGTCYFIAYFFVIHTVRLVGAASTTVVSSLSIMVPIIAAAAIWSERPTILQAFGIGLALIALILIGTKRGEASVEHRAWFVPLLMLAFFVLAGASRLAQEAFHHVSDPSQRPTFLSAAFVLAAIPSIYLLVSKRRWPSRMEWLFGTTIGSANILQTHFMILALGKLEGFVVFPLTSAGGLIVTAVAAQRLLSEKISRRALLGIGLAVAALICLNWLPDGGVIALYA